MASQVVSYFYTKLSYRYMKRVLLQSCGILPQQLLTEGGNMKCRSLVWQ